MLSLSPLLLLVESFTRAPMPWNSGCFSGVSLAILLSTLLIYVNAAYSNSRPSCVVTTTFPPFPFPSLPPCSRFVKEVRGVAVKWLSLLKMAPAMWMKMEMARTVTLTAGTWVCPIVYSGPFFFSLFFFFFFFSLPSPCSSHFVVSPLLPYQLTYLLAFLLYPTSHRPSSPIGLICFSCSPPLFSPPSSLRASIRRMRIYCT